jgi:DUF971 family protein
MASSLDPNVARPVDLHVDKQRGLRIRWADGGESLLPLPFLRRRCPCATCRAEPASATGVRLPVFGGVGSPDAARVADAELVGNYALKITWADGHSTGIYDFEYLRQLADELAGNAPAAHS